MTDINDINNRARLVTQLVCAHHQELRKVVGSATVDKLIPLLVPFQHALLAAAFPELFSNPPEPDA